MDNAFHHRTAFAVWINDMRHVGMPGQKWPYTKIDDLTIEGLESCFDLMARAGFTEFDVFGLFTAYAWPVDVASAVSEERAQRVRSILDYAHAKGIRVVCGLGVYSWGFDEIIARNPDVQGTNLVGDVFVARRVVGVDDKGHRFHLDQLRRRRVPSRICRSRSVRLRRLRAMVRRRIPLSNSGRTAQYVRSIKPGAMLTCNLVGLVPWGSTLTEQDRAQFVALSHHIDSLIDPGLVGKLFIAEDHLEGFIRSLHCDFGTSGGAWVYPAQRWDRLRWFLPYTRRTGAHIRELYALGGRAIDYFMGPTNNPGVEMCVAFGGLVLSDVTRSDEDILGELVDELYQPHDRETKAEIVSIFQRAESGYYDNFDAHAPRSAEVPGELHLAPLFGSESGPAIYLAGTRPDDQPFSGGGLAAYRATLVTLLDDVTRLHGRVDDGGRLDRMTICITNVIADIDQF